jgi:type IV pilus assembly protein PilO
MDINVDFSDKKVQQITVILLIGIVLSGLIYWFQIKDNRVLLESEISKRDAKQLELNKVKQLKPKLEELRVAVNKLRDMLTELETKFPSSANTPSLISSITKMAKDNQLYVINFKPLPRAEKEYYVEHQYQLDVIGSYHKLGKFFQDLADYELIVNVSQVSLKTSGILSKDLAEYRALELGDMKYDDRIKSISAKFKLSTYSSKDEATK